MPAPVDYFLNTFAWGLRKETLGVSTRANG